MDSVNQANNRSKLASDLRQVFDDVDQLLSQAASATGQQAQELRERAATTLRSARYKLQDVQASALESGKAAARATDDWVRDNPWGAVGVAAGVGFLLGLLINRR
ncbi:MAG TPA: DUF883 family protein [Burkholderiaceae bacterium]|nr:DUF883 family protein [Burkholderiaceae bacterium]